MDETILYVTYPVPHPGGDDRKDEAILALATEHGGRDIGSGTTFQVPFERDLDFAFPSADQAARFAAALPTIDPTIQVKVQEPA